MGAPLDKGNRLALECLEDKWDNAASVAAVQPLLASKRNSLVAKVIQLHKDSSNLVANRLVEVAILNPSWARTAVATATKRHRFLETSATRLMQAPTQAAHNKRILERTTLANRQQEVSAPVIKTTKEVLVALSRVRLVVKAAKEKAAMLAALIRVVKTAKLATLQKAVMLSIVLMVMVAIQVLMQVEAMLMWVSWVAMQIAIAILALGLMAMTAMLTILAKELAAAAPLVDKAVEVLALVANRAAALEGKVQQHKVQVQMEALLAATPTLMVMTATTAIVGKEVV